MRSAKTILLVGEDDNDLSLLRFTIHNARPQRQAAQYKVTTATSAQEAIATFSQNQFDLVLAFFSLTQMDGAQLVERLKQIASHIPMILIGDPFRVHCADAMIARKNCSAEELLDRIKVMSARKRGPRKGTVYPDRRKCNTLSA